MIEDFSARALAVRKVTSNPGGTTPGTDGEVWNTPRQKREAIMRLRIKTRDYKASPVRRVWIPKLGTEEMRPLGIPTMFDRAYQALIKLSAEPITECMADTHSFGFRPRRSCHDALAYINICLSNPQGAVWVLDADIKGFFDNINHSWIKNHVKVINPRTLGE